MDDDRLLGGSASGFKIGSRKMLQYTGLSEKNWAALHQGAPGQMTWLEDPGPYSSALPIALLCFRNSVNRK